MQNPTNNELKKILIDSKTIAVVGASDKPTRDSYQIMKFLIDHGYNVIPVNPTYSEILGRKCYPDLRVIEDQIDIVDVFRRSDEILPIVQDAIIIGAPTIWMQLGVINEEAAEVARNAGLNVVMNRCIKIEHNMLLNS